MVAASAIHLYFSDLEVSVIDLKQLHEISSPAELLDLLSLHAPADALVMARPASPRGIHTLPFLVAVTIARRVLSYVRACTLGDRTLRDRRLCLQYWP